MNKKYAVVPFEYTINRHEGKYIQSYTYTGYKVIRNILGLWLTVAKFKYNNPEKSANDFLKNIGGG